jgi:hypothetical protein
MFWGVHGDFSAGIPSSESLAFLKNYCRAFYFNAEPLTGGAFRTSAVRLDLSLSIPRIVQVKMFPIFSGITDEPSYNYETDN